MDGHPPVTGLAPAGGVRGLASGLVIVDRRVTAWRAAFAVLALGIAAVLVLAREPAVGAVRVWIDSATFNHGFLILPISLYMIWERRACWRHLAPRPAWTVLLLVPAVGFVYLVGAVTNILEIEQFATVAFIEALILCVFGWRLYGALLLPLLYLFFLVPSGEWLVPTLQDFTARFVIHALHLAGVPLYSDGVLISIPEADFRIAEACAGIRFLIASIAFGCLFADLVYTSLWRKAVFIVLSTIVPVFANGLRAFGIVMIAHWTNAHYAVGVDHIVYGWVFFTAVTMLLMAIGWTFRDRAGPTMASPPTATAAPAGALVVAGLAAAVLAAAAPAYARYLDAVPPAVALDRLSAPSAPVGWQRDVPTVTEAWRPVFVGADREIEASYRSVARRVRLVIAFYSRQRQGAKALSSLNRIADDQIWQRASTEPMRATIDGRIMTVPASRLVSGSSRQLAWQWYWIGGRETASALDAKLFQLETTLIEGRRSAAAIALAAPYDEDPAEAAASLAAFMAARPDIAGMLGRAAATDGG